MKRVSERLVRRMLEVLLEARQVVELDDGGVVERDGHQLLVVGAVRHAPADVEPPNGGDALERRLERLDEAVAIGRREIRTRAEERDVEEHGRQRGFRSRGVRVL